MIGSYLVFTNEANAWAKAEEEGRLQCPLGWDGDNTTQYITVPEQTDAGTFALEVSDYTALTSDEVASVVNEVLFRWELDD
jgi:hypothetical protein